MQAIHDNILVHCVFVSRNIYYMIQYKKSLLLFFFAPNNKFELHSEKVMFLALQLWSAELCFVVVVVVSFVITIGSNYGWMILFFIIFITKGKN